MTRPVLVAHGTRHAPGNDVARSLAAAVGERLGEPVAATYVELAAPLLTDHLAACAEPSVVVPLLLSTGFHVRVDLPEMAAAAPGAVAMTEPIGPSRLLAAAQVARLVEAGARPGSPVVMVAAGSRDPASTADLEAAVEHLAEAWGAPVRLATVTGLGRRPAEVVRPGDAVSPYLLAPGFFSRRAADESRSAGAAVVADVIGPHPHVVDLVLARLAVAPTAG